jgi:tetratricopeptide (TPR) repeat protein
VIYQSRFALGQGRFSDAVSALLSALKVDPYSPALNGWLAWAHHLGGDSREALEQVDRALTLFPDHPEVLLFAVNILASADRDGEPDAPQVARAAALAIRLTRMSPSFDAGYAALAYVQARQGHSIEARTLLDRQHWLSRERFVMQSCHAPALVELGEVDAAIAVLTQAERDHCPWLFELLHDPRLGPLKGEDEFQRLHRLTRQSASRGASVA